MTIQNSSEFTLSRYIMWLLCNGLHNVPKMTLADLNKYLFHNLKKKSTENFAICSFNVMQCTRTKCSYRDLVW